MEHAIFQFKSEKLIPKDVTDLVSKIFFSCKTSLIYWKPRKGNPPKQTEDGEHLETFSPANEKDFDNGSFYYYYQFFKKCQACREPCNIMDDGHNGIIYLRGYISLLAGKHF